MKQYLLSVYHPEEGLAPEVEEKAGRDVDALNQEMKAAGAWVFAGGLHPASTATALRVQNGEVVTTDGPFAEGKEHVAGFWVIKAPDLDAALAWGRKATRACAVPIEVRPFQGETED
ncbi:MAG TPA: YciI family protein [Candidatus Dormibacteraeota bacterium]